jgi:hypothetical protein
VLSTYADTLLRINSSCEVALTNTKEDILELIHPSVRKEQRRIAVRHYRSRWHNAMSALFKERQIGLSYLS